MQRLHVLAVGIALAACSSSSSDDGAAVSTDALVAGHGGVVGPVKVEADRLVIQRDGNEALLASDGKVLVGGSEHSADNPYGFLRRVVSASVLDDTHLAIATTDASLGDAIQEGSVDTSHELDPTALRIVPLGNGNGVVSSPSARGLDIEVGETSLLDWHGHFHDPTRLLPVTDFDLSRSVKLTHADVHFEPSVDLAIAIHGGKVDSLDAVARGALSGSFDLVVDTRSSIDIDRNPLYHDTLKTQLRAPAIKVGLFETEPYVLPAQFIGWVPVIETVRFRVVLECDIDLTSQMHLETGAKVKSNAAFGVRYHGGQWLAAEQPSLTATPTFAMSGSGSVSGMCDLRTEVGFYIYDLIGPTLSVSPYVTFDVAPGGAGYQFSASPGIRGAFGGRMQVMGWEIVREDVSLFDSRSHSPFKGSLGL